MPPSSSSTEDGHAQVQPGILSTFLKQQANSVHLGQTDKAPAAGDNQHLICVIFSLGQDGCLCFCCRMSILLLTVTATRGVKDTHLEKGAFSMYGLW